MLLEVSEFDDSERPASITKDNNINKKRIPSPPQTKPSRAYSSSITSSSNSIYNSNNTSSVVSSKHNIHRNNIEQIKAASFAAVRRTSTSNLKLSTTTVDIENNSYSNSSGSSSGEEKGLASDCEIDEDDELSPIGDIKINRMKVTRLEKTRPPLQHQQQMLSSSSTTNTTSTTSTIPTTTSGTTTTTTTLADQKASALSKYRQYVALNTTSSNKNNTSNNTITNNSSSGNSSNCSSTTSLTAPKWSDIGKHDKLFQKVDLNTPETLYPKSRPPYTKHSTVTDKDYSQSSSTYNKHSTTTTANTLYTAVDDESSSMHDSVEYIPDQGEYLSPPRGLYTVLSHITTATTSTTNKSISQQYTPSHLNDSYNSANNSDTVEVFVLSDSSNPPSPARSKPNRPIFKPPYSKPVFNEFTPNKAITSSGSSSSNTNTSTTSGNNSSSNYKTKTTTPTTTPTTTTTNNNNKVIKKEYPSHTNFPSKEKFNAYVSQRGSAYFTDKDNNNNSDEEKSVDYNTTTITTNNNTSTTSSNNKNKNVHWLDTKESSLATSYHESTVGVRENDSFVGMEMLYYVYIVYTIYYILYTECMFYICIYICIVYIYVQYI